MSFIVQPQTFFSIGPSRSFAGISGYVTIQESAVDALEITQQPVQQGAMISDHAFKKPVSFSIQMLFKDNLTQSLKDIYLQLRDLQNSRKPFSCVTPKRTYSSMLMATLGQTTDKLTENCLAITANFQEVITVPVGITTVPRTQLKDPGTNGATQKVGKKSALLTLVQGIGGTP